MLLQRASGYLIQMAQSPDPKFDDKVLGAQKPELLRSGPPKKKKRRPSANSPVNTGKLLSRKLAHMRFNGEGSVVCFVFKE